MIKELKNQKGVVLIVTVLMTAIILVLAVYYLTFSLTEKKISKSQVYGQKTYYLAEAGIEEMIWKLKNDAAYKSSFETNPAWSASFTRNNPFGADSGSYTVGITNTALAHSIIRATSTISLGTGKTSQRVVEIRIYKALGTNPLNDVTGYGDHDLTISNGLVDYINSSVYAVHDVKISGLSDVHINRDLNAGHSYSKSFLSSVTIGGAVHTSTIPPPPADIEIPAIDFDSADPNSYRNRANTIYTSAQIASLISGNTNITLNGPVTYVNGDVDLNGAKNFIINGLLVVSHDFNVGRTLCNGWSCGLPSLRVNHATGTPSGILVRHRISFQTFAGSVNINGLAYSAQDFNISGLPLSYDFNINGAAVGGHDLSIDGLWRTVNITRNDENISGIIGESATSQIIQVEHWEEEY